MALTLEQAVGQQFLLSFIGKQQPSPEILDIMRRQHIGGIVLFRHKNMGTLAELRKLTAALQKAAADSKQPPLLIAADQEGGQLMAIGEGTQFPGNMALGATRSEKLAQGVGQAIGRELAAVGVNVDFAPVCDVNNNPRNPVVGTRSFGDDPALVGRLSAALIKGLQSSGVAATAKHFPGHGDVASDSHHSAPVGPHDARRIARIELPPFRAAIKAGVRLIMTAHIIMPALNGGTGQPATVSPAILRDLLRKKLGFGGLIVGDAMDMHAMEQGHGYIAEAMAAVAAGLDLVLLNHDLSRIEAAFANVVHAAKRGLLSSQQIAASPQRILALKAWISRTKQPTLSVVACRDHVLLARQVSEKSITLVRDTARRLPLRLRSDARIAVVVPRPQDLTPADTSSYVTPALAAAIRRYHAQVDEFLIAMNPEIADVKSLREKLKSYDLVIVGTINATAHRGQADLVNAVLKQGTPLIAVALRMPYDLAVYPSAATYVCAYSILPPSMDALAAAMWGRIPFRGRLPVTIPQKL
ncbi:MAG TPA: glycoside hydrolase family 3 N-terminal domain-containing protein [Candidatus Angelobacter sp.]|nr:glycoside hydrolase family 3 N-terminal domain-containing protein [Candidatus Angelobacter sp.]